VRHEKVVHRRKQRLPLLWMLAGEAMEFLDRMGQLLADVVQRHAMALLRYGVSWAVGV
jgi:hypothetical protein